MKSGSYRRRVQFAVAVVGTLLTVFMAASRTSARQSDRSGRAVTFSKDIAPILQRSCQTCHRPDGGAPMPLVTYEDVRPWAKAIARRTALREMPPWYIEKNIGIQKFKDDPSLSDDEIARIARWADEGALQGNPSEMPPPRQFHAADTWEIGQPDLVLSSPVVDVKAVAPDFFGPLRGAPSGLTEDRYIKAVEVKEVRLEDKSSGLRPAGGLNLFAVHHAEITTGVSRVQEIASGERVANHFNNNDFNIVYELGQNAMVYPDELGVVLKAGSTLNFPDVHLHSVGRDVPVRIDVGFTFHPRGYKPKYVQPGGLLVMTGQNDLDIPPGEDNVRFDGFFVMPTSGKMLTFEPHLHSSGKRMCAEAIYPTGERETLNCSGYNHNWVRAYVYQDDVAPLLPKGTVVHLTAWYNNTAKNPRVVDPRNWKGWGNRSIEDMFILLPRVVELTDDQLKQERAARETRQHPQVASGAR